MERQPIESKSIFAKIILPHEHTKNVNIAFMNILSECQMTEISNKRKRILMGQERKSSICYLQTYINTGYMYLNIYI